MGESAAESGVKIVAADQGGFLLEGGDRDWLRAVFVAFGYRAAVHKDALYIPSADKESIMRTIRTALAPQAIILDLDGVLADIHSRKRIASVADVERLAAERPIGVVTTCPRNLAESVLDHHGFLPHVRVVIGSEDGPCKPDPFPVRLALQQLGQSAAWMLGDNPSDVIAARSAAVVPLAVLPHGIGSDAHLDRLRSAGAVRFVDGVGGLLALLAD